MTRVLTIGEQLPGIETFQYLATTFPGLPSAYLTAHAFTSMGVQLLVETGSDVEAWRSALQVPAHAVIMHVFVDYTSIQFTTTVRDVPVKVYGHTALVPDRAKLTPAEDAAFQAAMLVQRHELEDPAEPPLPGAQPVEQVEVRTLADMPGGAA